MVEGVRRIRNGAPTHGAEKANILCRKHNSLLSPLDEVAGNVAAFQASTGDELAPAPLYVEGELLERWLLKTVINSAAAGWTGPRKWLPSPDIVAAIFGLAPIPDRMGLYSVDGVDATIGPAGGVTVTPIHGRAPAAQVLLGAYVAIHGMPLLVAFHADLAQALEAGAAPDLTPRFCAQGLKHLYHPGAIVVSRIRGRPAFIGLSWNGLLRFADGTSAPFPAGQGSRRSRPRSEAFACRLAGGRLGRTTHGTTQPNLAVLPDFEAI